MLTRLREWQKRACSSPVAKARLGFGIEYWDLNPEHYEGWEKLRDRRTELGHSFTDHDLAHDLASHLLDELIVAAGGVERAINKLLEARGLLNAYVRDQGFTACDRVPLDLSHDGSVEAWYAFSDVLSWSRTVQERLERDARDKKKFHGHKQGLIPALKPEQLKKRCEGLSNELRKGPVGEARPLANFILHNALVQNPFSGVQVKHTGTVALPIPDCRVASHRYLLKWDQNRDGFVFAEDLWQAIQKFIDEILDAFETSVPKRLRR